MQKYLILLILSFIIGCNNSQNLDDTNYDKPIPPESGGILTNAMIGEPNNLIAMIAGDSASSAIAGQIFNSLLKYDENLGFEGDLADSWTISDDYKKITFYLLACILLVSLSSAALNYSFGSLTFRSPIFNNEEEVEGKTRVVLSLKPHLSPIKAAVIPLKRNNEDLVNHAKDLKNKLQMLGMGRVILENSGNIGKSYRRHDEVGTPICITVDFETLENQTVTVRDRDTMEQKRLGPDELINYYGQYFE